MAGISLDQAQAQLDQWLAASTAVAQSQRYRISVNGSERELTRADAAEIRQQIQFWDEKVKRLTPSTRGRTRFAVPE